MITINKQTLEVKFNQSARALNKKEFFKLNDTASYSAILRSFKSLGLNDTELELQANKLGTSLKNLNNGWGLK